ncbi:hypothetical protein SGQ44_18130 [Flavobacterium sp. Fl-77]|uniref:Sel1 repeat family protein n=1 Tax=Flavobacterium flavipigmentatum TaxID=2893884 RepID=A0AAJ2VZT7_9FLAO|nr:MULTISPECIES: hypothetical protein [unclassified Flavobacterium]MDX6184085.1 hypothetical protein [Flavobacterium sp. Fl-33]MDX6187679.1 hypothetical protein [Flavobacterium sp. Fl-77]UFH39197.1 hypothetical protein LNP22_02710 [Flavobacterium sp. F-70]
MTLYYASEALRCDEFVPNKKQWLKEAIANNNQDAILAKVKSLPYMGTESIGQLEKVANLGNLDAMIILAMWYSRKNNYKGLVGGEDQEKSLKWFNKAAGAGSPNAMYFLGMIYKYKQITRDKYEQPLFIKYDIAPDERFALNWFIKADQPNYKESIYSRSESSTHTYLASSSYNVPSACYEIFLLYKNGKVVKDKAKAIEMKSKVKYLGMSGSYKDDNRINEKFSDIKRY